MANQTINGLSTQTSGEDINRTADKFVIWDASESTSAQVAASEVVTTGEVDPGSTTQATGLVNKIVSCSQSEYDTIAAGTPDPATLYVITDGKTKDSYVGQIDTLGDTATYVLDFLPVTERTVLSFKGEYTGTASGISIALKVGSTTIATQDLSVAGTGAGFNATVSGAPVDSTDKITLVTSGDASAVTDFAFVVEYQS